MISATRCIPVPLAAAALAAALGLAACASRPVDAQWADPQMAGTSLRGAQVLVVCEAQEVVLSRLCVDRLSASLQARGATVVTASQAAAPAQGQGGDARYVEQARAARATALWATSVGPETFASDYRASPGFSIGLGGFVGRGSGVGVGVGVPIGSATATPLYAADVRVTDVASGRLVWTARAGSPPAGEVGRQLDDLLQRLVTAAGEAQLF